MGSETSIHKEAWPTYDPEAIKVDEVEVLIQVNGKGQGPDHDRTGYQPG